MDGLTALPIWPPLIDTTIGSTDPELLCAAENVIVQAPPRSAGYSLGDRTAGPGKISNLLPIRRDDFRAALTPAGQSALLQPRAGNAAVAREGPPGADRRRVWQVIDSEVGRVAPVRVGTYERILEPEIDSRHTIRRRRSRWQQALGDCGLWLNDLSDGVPQGVIVVEVGLVRRGIGISSRLRILRPCRRKGRPIVCDGLGAVSHQVGRVEGTEGAVRVIAFPIIAFRATPGPSILIVIPPGILSAAVRGLERPENSVDSLARVVAVGCVP